MLTTSFLIAILAIDDPVASDLASIGATSSRQVVFLDSKGMGGTRISQDGSLLFSNSARNPLISLRSGRLIHEEHSRVGYVDASGWVVGTMSQWGHIKPNGPLLDASIQDAASETRWLGLAMPDRKETGEAFSVVIADIDTRKRGLMPNRQVEFIESKSDLIPARRQFLAWFSSRGEIVFEALVRAPGNKCRIQRWLVRNNAKHAAMTTKDLEGPWSKSRKPVEYDPAEDAVLYRTPGEGEWREWRVNTRSWVQLSNLNRNAAPFYWRGSLLQASGHDLNRPYGIDLFSGDRASVRHLGPYDWLAESSNSKYALVRRETDSTYWLVSFGEFRGASEGTQ